MKIVRVKSQVSSKRLAGVIIRDLLEDGTVDVQAVGAAAVNQGLKAIILATESQPLSNELCSIVPRFEDCLIGSEHKTGISILVKR